MSRTFYLFLKNNILPFGSYHFVKGPILAGNICYKHSLETTILDYYHTRLLPYPIVTITDYCHTRLLPYLFIIIPDYCHSRLLPYPIIIIPIIAIPDYYHTQLLPYPIITIPGYIHT